MKREQKMFHVEASFIFKGPVVSRGEKMQVKDHQAATVPGAEREGFEMRPNFVPRMSQGS